MKRLPMTKVLVFSGVLIIHWGLQFISWSYAERSALMRILWNILATPLIHVSGPIAIQYFWIVATANSVLWAIVTTYVVSRYLLR
jgi:hypothetical protein